MGMKEKYKVGEHFYWCKRCDVDLIIAKIKGYLIICVCKSCGKVFAYYDTLMKYIDEKNGKEN